MTSKSVFIAYANEDEGSRNLFTSESVGAQTPFELVEMSSATPFSNEWKAWSKSMVKRADGVIALLSPSTPASPGELWVLHCAMQEGKPLLGIWLGDYDVKPVEMKNAPCVIWTWPNVAGFIDRL
jgi:hypothetical protein